MDTIIHPGDGWESIDESIRLLRTFELARIGEFCIAGLNLVEASVVGRVGNSKAVERPALVRLAIRGKRYPS